MAEMFTKFELVSIIILVGTTLNRGGRDSIRVHFAISPQQSTWLRVKEVKHDV